MFGDPANPAKALAPQIVKALKRRKNDPEYIVVAGEVVNSLFPSRWDKPTKAAAKTLNFQPELDDIYNNYSESADPQLAQEATNLYINLSEKQNDDMTLRAIQKILRDLKNNLDGANSAAAADNVSQLLPYVNHPVFINKFDELNILDYIVRMEKHEQAQLLAKTGKKAPEMIGDGLSSIGVPDIGSKNRKLLEPEKQLADNLAHLILSFPEPLRAKVRTHKEIPKLTDAFLLIQGGLPVFDILSDLLANEQNQQPLAENSGIKNAIYCLMKNNKDAFKP